MSILRPRKKYIIAVFLLIIAAVVGVGAYYYSMADKLVQNITTSGTAADLLTPQPLNGESTGAVNILIAGNSADDPHHGGALLTDSIMVAHYDLSSHKLTLISVPRDLYVNVSGTYQKINTAYVLGGMPELAQIVQKVTGLTINQRVLIDYSAFRDMIDAIGGIDVTIKADDPRGIYDPMVGFTITNGPHHLNGTQALLLARSRNDPTYDGRVPYGLSRGDFDRTANQRMIMQAVINKINATGALANPITLQRLVTSLSGNVKTDLTAGQLRRLYDLSKQVQSQQSIGLDTNGSGQYLLKNYYTPAVGDALIPIGGIGNYQSIQQYVASVTTPSSNTANGSGSATNTAQ